MEVYFYYQTVEDIPLYNCSALTREVLDRSNGVQRPVRGAITFIGGTVMMLVYIVCLRVMVKLALIRLACYKIMLVIGYNEITAVLVNDVIMAYIISFGMSFCDAPNTLYIMGCLHIATWTGASYQCLLLAFNRMMEVSNIRGQTTDILLSPLGTTIGITVGCIYSLLFMLFCTPTVYSNEFGTVLPNPLGLEMPARIINRHVIMVASNCGFVVINCIVYGIFCVILRNKFKILGFSHKSNRSQRQVFIQSIVLCGLNFVICSIYLSFLFVGDNMILPIIPFMGYQLSAGLQALIYLLFNQTISDGVKRDFYEVLNMKRNRTTAMGVGKAESTRTTLSEKNVTSVPTVF